MKRRLRGGWMSKPSNECHGSHTGDNCTSKCDDGCIYNPDGEWDNECEQCGRSTPKMYTHCSKRCWRIGKAEYDADHAE